LVATAVRLLELELAELWSDAELVDFDVELSLEESLESDFEDTDPLAASLELLVEEESLSPVDPALVDGVVDAISVTAVEVVVDDRPKFPLT
jgi:hypothetical protein